MRPFVFPLLLGAYLALALVLGGATGQGGWPDGLLAVLALPLLAAGVWHLQAIPATWVMPLLVLVLATLALPLVQLLPWVHFPGVGPALAQTQAAFGLAPLPVLGVDAPAAWSLAPQATVWSLMALLPPLAVLVAACSLEARTRGSLLRVVWAVAVVQAVVAILQTPNGGAVLPAYQGAGLGEQARGFFANRNHLGLFMLFGALLSAAEIGRRAARAVESGHWPSQAAGLMLAVAGLLLCLVALLLSQSRAAVGLGLGVGVVVALRVVFLPGRQAGTRRLFLALAGVAMLAVNLGAYGVMQRFATDPLDANRAVLARQTASLAVEAMPWGTGLGSFPVVYAHREPSLGLGDALVNRAHNDWLELWLEAGLAGLVLIAAWLAMLAWRLLRRGPWGARVSVAVLGLGVLAGHSVVDYPLRTVALACVAGLLLAEVLARNSRATG